MKQILHIFNKNVFFPEYYHMGSTRDTRGRFEYFRERGIQSEHLVLNSRSDDVLCKLLQDMDSNRISGYKAIVFEYPRYPKSIKYLRKAYPDIRLFIRSHNAEVYHQMHYALATLKFSTCRSDLVQSYKFFKLSLSRIMLDRQCSKFSHGIFSITEWESNNYWKWYLNKDKIFTVPYFIPSEYIDAERPAIAKKNQCVCLMSPFKGRLVFLEDALRNYVRCINQMPSNNTDWKFLVTGELSYYNLSLPDNLIATGFVDSTFDLMLESRAMTLLSDYGFGFKTKILEAIKARCYVLLTRKLYNRLPERVKPFCIVVDPNVPESFYQALELAQKPFPDIGANVNNSLKMQAFQELDNAFNQIQINK